MAAKPEVGTTRSVPVSAAALEAARLRAGALGRRFAVADLDDVLVAGAVAYARSYRGAFPFMVMMRPASHRPLSVSQTVGVLNCLRADVLHQGPSRQVDIAGVPDGAYAVENLSRGITFLRFARVAAGPRTGWVLVDQEVGDDLQARGHQRLGGSYRGLLAELVAAVVVLSALASAALCASSSSCVHAPSSSSVLPGPLDWRWARASSVDSP